MTKTSVESILEKLRKQYGDEGIFNGADNMTVYTDIIPTGSYLLDDALGIWGIPRGRIVQFAGQESSGKTFMALILIAQYQKINPNGWAVFVDAEFTFDAEWAADLGVDLNRLLVIRENSATKIFERLVGQPSKTNPKNKAKLGILDHEMENPSELGIIVIDSVAAMTPPMEETSEVGKANMALMARFLPPELRKITPMLSATGTTLIGINQVRVDPGVMYGNPETSPGGKAWKHSCSMMLNFAKMNGKESSIVDTFDNQIGHHVRVRVDKNKLAPPFRKAEFAILYTHGIAELNVEVRKLATKYGILERPNNKTWICEGEKYIGISAMDNALIDEELRNTILQKVKEAKFSGKEASEVLEEEVVE